MMKAGFVIGMIAGSAIGAATMVMCMDGKSKKKIMRKGRRMLHQYTDLV